MPTWTIINGDGISRTFGEIGIETVVKRRISQSVDSCEIRFAAGDILSSVPWVNGESIQVKMDSTVWFRGNVGDWSASANGRSEKLSVQVNGPFWYLENLVYLQQAIFVTDPDEDPTPSAEVLTIEDFTTEYQNTSRIILPEDNDGDKVNTSDMISALLDYAIAKGVPIQKGTIDTGVDIPKQNLEAVTIAEAIRKCLRYTPDQTTRIDYSTNPPTIHIRSRDNLTPLTVDLADEEVEQIELSTCYRLKLNGVRIEYYTENERDGFVFRSVSLDEAGTSPEGVSSLVVPVDLFGSYVFNGSVLAAEVAPSGVAQKIYDHYKNLHYEGRLRLAQEDLASVDWLSYKLNVDGGHPNWSSMNAVIQSSVEDVFSGRTELTIGFPKQLGPADLINLLRAGRTPEPTTLEDVLTKNGGGLPRTSKLPADAQDPRLEFNLNNPPDVVLRCHQVHYKGTAGTSWVTFTRYHWDQLAVYDEVGGDFVAITTPYLNGSKMGTVVDFHGFSVGYASGYTVHGTYGITPPNGVDPPQYAKGYYGYQAEKTIVPAADIEIEGGYSSP